MHLDLDQAAKLSRLSSEAARNAQRTVAAVHAGYDAQKGATALSEIDAAMARLDAATDEMRTAVTNMTERLEPVLKQEPNANGSDDMKSEIGSTAPLVASIDRQSTRLRTTIAALREISNRLAL
ncbi:hypothetical protein ACCQ08_03085 [Comamonas sp. SY3]|uniref:hypothetical protein n=1 Tax=Comamonas sp. SY3 TaxID=3243601 RepID=UPI003593ABDD